MDTRLQDLEIEIKTVQLAREQLALRNELERSSPSKAIATAQAVGARTLEVGKNVGSTGIKAGSRVMGFVLRFTAAGIVAIMVLFIGAWWIASFNFVAIGGDHLVDVWASKYSTIATLVSFFVAFVRPPHGKLPTPPPTGNMVERALTRTGERFGLFLVGDSPIQRFVFLACACLGLAAWFAYIYVRIFFKAPL